MKLLLVENDLTFLEVLSDALQDIDELSLDIVRSRDSAYAILNAKEFDLVVCDLRIPTQDGGLDEDIKHGVAVLGRVETIARGTPVLVLSAFATIDVLTDMLRAAQRHDIFGTGATYPMLDFVVKTKLSEFVAKIEALVREIADLQRIEISTATPELHLGDSEKRILRIFARRLQGTIVEVSAIGGGMSRSRTLRLRVLDQYSATKSLAVGKLGTLEDIKLENERYQNYVAPRLPVGTFTPRMAEVTAGAGNSGGLFYTLAVEYQDSLFGVLGTDPNRAALVVTRLRSQLKPWRDGAPSRLVTVRELRRALLNDSAVWAGSAELAGVPWDRFENQSLQIRECCQHRDLHGLNVLVAEEKPIVIDYGEVALAAASLDPVTLELSVVFHPSGQNIRGGWPSAAQAEKWHDLDQYVNGCPVPGFVRACREWALEAKVGNRELYANAYAYCARQLKYSDTDHSVAAAVVRGVIAAFETT